MPWALLLQESKYVIEHKSGAKMLRVNVLSRFPVDVMSISVDNILLEIKLV